MDTEWRRGSKVKITSIPWHFSAGGYEQLEQLFVPLLSSAQQASDLMGVRARGESSAVQAAVYMAGELLRDTSFVPAKLDDSGSSHLYELDFISDSFSVRSDVFCQIRNKEALFRVDVKGRIRGDKFEVLDREHGTTLFCFTRFEAEKQNFFSSEFPFLVQEARRDPTLFGSTDEDLSGEFIDLVLGVPVAGSVVTVKVKKDRGDQYAQVKDPGSEADIMRLPLASLNNISKTVKTIGEFLMTHPDIRQTLLAHNETPSTETAPASPESKSE